MYIRRPKSMVPSMTKKKTIASSANSTVAAPRCGRILEEGIKDFMASSVHVAHGSVRSKRDTGVAGAGNERHDATNGDAVAGNADLYVHVRGRGAVDACRSVAGDADG